jgi:hypothetical protein
MTARTTNLLLLLGFGLLAVVGAEAVLRAYPNYFIYASMRNVVQVDCTRPDSGAQYVNRENYVGRFDNHEFRTIVRINSKGLRDKEYPYEKPPGRTRCLLLGDSFVFGWGVEAEESVGKVMEERDDNLDVINAGCSGWSTKQEVAFFKEEGLRYHPDIVLLFFCENDPYENPLRYTFVDGKLAYAGRPEGRLADLRRWLAKHSAFWNLLRQVRGAPVEEWGASAPGAPLWEAEALYLRDLKASCGSTGAHLAIVHVPLKGRKGFGRHGSWFKPLQIFCSFEKIPFLDLVPEMSAGGERRSLYYQLDDHWNRRGHRVAAKAVLRFLRETAWIED